MWSYACGDGATEPPPPAPDPPLPAAIAVAPATIRLTALGATEQLTAEVRDQNGNPMARAAVSWASSAAAVATVSASGSVTAIANGTATITATAGSASGNATVTVAQEVGTVAVTPAADTVVAGGTLRLTPEAADANGHPVAATEFVWASSDTLVAVVDDAGLVTGVGAGEAEVTASAAGVSGRAALTVVAPAPTTVAVIPDTVPLTALGQTARLAAEVRDQIGRVMEGVPVSWSSADTLVATVDSTGLVIAIGGGTTTVTATVGAVFGTAVVVIRQSAGSVVVSPPTATIALGDTLRLVAKAFDENGHVVGGAEFAWSSSDPSVATVDASGLVSGVTEGKAAITATTGSSRETAQITVANPDRAALVTLFRATDGPNWLYSENWLTSTPLREWYGVETDAQDRVTSLRLDSNELSGPIPPELGNLASVTVLWLDGNKLSGPIPPELGALANLEELRLSYNALTGAIPSEFANLANLTELALAANSLSGSIQPEPFSTLANLTELWLGGNSFSGAIPPELGNLAALTALELSSNGFSGAIPPELGDLANLKVLRLAFNALAGPIPLELGRLARLEELSLRGNRGLCLPADPQFLAWLAERFSFSFFPCERPVERLLPSALLREDGNGLSLLLPDDLRQPSAVMVSDTSVVAASAVGGWLELSPRGRGSAEVKVTSSGGGDPAIARVAVRAAVGTFGIDVVLERPAPTAYEETLVTIADWWSSVLDGTEWPDRPMTCYGDRMKAQVDDMLIYALTYYRTSDTDATGYANSCPPQSGFPIGGVLGMAYGFGHSRQTMAHEIGHHLGLVGLWPPHLRTEDWKYFIGPRAVKAYREAGGDPSLPGVPMDNGGHWRGDVNDWLMYSGNRIDVSLAALADAGYAVDTTKTRPVGKPEAAAPSFVNDLVPRGPTAPRPGAAMDSVDPRPPPEHR